MYYFLFWHNTFQIEFDRNILREFTPTMCLIWAPRHLLAEADRLIQCSMLFQRLEVSAWPVLIQLPQPQRAGEANSLSWSWKQYIEDAVTRQASVWSPKEQRGNIILLILCCTLHFSSLFIVNLGEYSSTCHSTRMEIVLHHKVKFHVLV